MNQTDIIQAVMVTEKGTILGEASQYVLKVSPKATKVEIRKAVEARFGVHVLSVNTQNYTGKTKFTRTRRLTKASDWKRAIITVREGERIETV